MRIDARLAVLAASLIIVTCSDAVCRPAPKAIAVEGPLILRGPSAARSMDAGVSVSRGPGTNGECLDGPHCGSYDDHAAGAPSSSFTQLRPASFAR